MALRLDKIIDNISFTLLIATLLLLKSASKYPENIIYGKRFVWNYFLLGLIISIAWIYFLYKMKRSYFDGGEKRASAILSQFFGIILWTIFLSAYYTYQSGKENIYYKEAIVVYKTNNIKTGTLYTGLLIDGRKERFNPARKEFEKFSKGDTLLLTIGKGKTMYEYIYEFKVK